MRYKNIIRGIFILRENRFVARVMVDGEPVTCHVKNTGRCKELLVEGVTVILERSENPARKTEYDLIAVYKGDRLINIDSQAPNKVFYEWIERCGYFGDDKKIRPECIYKNSRFDFYIEAGERRIFAEIKGVTLEEDGVVLFPDAPTERGLKHLCELAEARTEGYETYVFFIVQMFGVKYFTPNSITHKEFADELNRVAKAGVGVLALDCTVTENELNVNDFVEVRL